MKKIYEFKRIIFHCYIIIFCDLNLNFELGLLLNKSIQQKIILDRFCISLSSLQE